MKEKLIKSTPGVLMGIVTNRAFHGKSAYFYDGPQLFLELSLNNIYSYTRNGIPEKEFEDKFFKHSLIMKYPEEAKEEDLEVFVY